MLECTSQYGKEIRTVQRATIAPRELSATSNVVVDVVESILEAFEK